MKNLRWVLVLVTFLFGGCAVDTLVDCANLCDRYEECFGTSDAECVDRCESRVDSGEVDQADRCDSCLDTSETCLEATLACTGDCAFLVAP